MRRGEIWTVAGGPDYAGKPRPAVVLQDDRFDSTQSVTICAFTSTLNDAQLIRLPIKPSESNGLRLECQLMVDKITTVPRAKLGSRLGRLADEDLAQLNRAVIVFLGIGAPASSEAAI
jgi:mRNA interferase MazF